MTKVPWRQPPYFDRFANRVKYLNECKKIDPCARFIKPRGRRGDGFGIAVQMKPVGVPHRHVEVHFTNWRPDSPSVYVDGPDDSPHRYPGGALCMWYPYDPPEARWRHNDGPGGLLGHVAAHLIKEEWFRRTGDWPGEVAPHNVKESQANE